MHRDLAMLVVNGFIRHDYGGLAILDPLVKPLEKPVLSKVGP